MNCNTILFILIILNIYLYYKSQKVNNKINPKKYNPAIYHPAAL